MPRVLTGFTVLELAIVLVLIGLLLGGMLKGQALIEEARVRQVINQLERIKAAFYAFQDRYQAAPGDYPGQLAYANLRGIVNAQVGGNGDGVVQDGVHARESLLVWVHLSHAKLMQGNYRATSSHPDPAGEWPRNPYYSTLKLHYDADFAASQAVARLNLKLGNRIPARILAEIDRRLDDGRADSGNFRFSAYNGGGGAPIPARCYDLHTGLWRAAENEGNCGAASLF